MVSFVTISLYVSSCTLLVICLLDEVYGYFHYFKVVTTGGYQGYKGQFRILIESNKGNKQIKD